MSHSRDMEISELPPAFVTGPEAFARAPMTFEGIIMQPGISGYRPPSADNQWLELRLQDGCWIRVRPVDEALLCYQILPLGTLANREGIKEEFLAIWAAYIRISRLATNALERAMDSTQVSDGQHTPVGIDETGSYTALVRVDHRPRGTRLIAEYAKQIGHGTNGEVGVAGLFGR